MDRNKPDTRTRSVEEAGIHGKHRTGIVGCDKVHSSAPIKGDKSRAKPTFTYWLKEWEEAQGVLQNVDIDEGILKFENFDVQIPSSRSADLSILEALIGRDVSVIRTDSPSHIIRAGGYREALPASTNISPPRAELTKIPKGENIHASKRPNTQKTQGPFD